MKCLVPESVNYQSSNYQLLSDVQFLHPRGPEKPPNKPSSLVCFRFKIGEVFFHMDVSEQKLFTKILKNAQGFLIEQSQCPLYPAGRGILLMEEIPHHLGSIKPCKWWDRLPINWCRISSIHSFTLILWQKYPIWHMMIFICSKEGANKKYQNLPIRFLLNKNGDYFISHKIHVIGIFTY